MIHFIESYLHSISYFIRLQIPPLACIREHALNCNHPIKIDNFSMLARCQDYDLRLLESIFTHKLSPNLNNR